MISKIQKLNTFKTLCSSLILLVHNTDTRGLRARITISDSAASSYRRADKSLDRPGRKQARKYVRDARNFNNIETNPRRRQEVPKNKEKMPEKPNPQKPPPT